MLRPPCLCQDSRAVDAGDVEPHVPRPPCVCVGGLCCGPDAAPAEPVDSQTLGRRLPRKPTETSQAAHASRAQRPFPPVLPRRPLRRRCAPPRQPHRLARPLWPCTGGALGRAGGGGGGSGGWGIAGEEWVGRAAGMRRMRWVTGRTRCRRASCSTRCAASRAARMRRSASVRQQHHVAPSDSSSRAAPLCPPSPAIPAPRRRLPWWPFASSRAARAIRVAPNAMHQIFQSLHGPEQSWHHVRTVRQQ